MNEVSVKAAAQHFLLMTLDSWKGAVDKNKAFGALMTDLSKAFDCLIHDLLIAALYDGFYLSSLKLLQDYLLNCRQRTKFDSKFTSWTKIISNGLVVKPLCSKSRGLFFKKTEWLQVWLSLSSFRGWSDEYQEFLETKW